ncbi:PREDICTED: desiccation-related protein PCC3-06-like isoform X2 [Lupinus angustifolius]|uniref:desiccation-related protein PCC3-06-like isoform X2 n=1 Tax=Lupinus angustifolius TaxID=3871 RepID=UPI00092E8536|nr:PREDICTED: desiccation-related protein PCC3-06-like isoform X2 [Lupinus angustifolius]
MATMFITRNAIFRFSKSFSFAYTPSLSLRFSQKPFRVVFSSVSNHSNWGNAAEGSRDSRGDSWVYDSTSTRREAEARENDRVKEGAYEMKERTKDYANDAKEKTKDVAGSMVDKAKQGTNRAKEYAHETKEEAKDAAGTFAEKTKEGANNATEKAKEYGHEAKERTKEGANKVAEAAGSATETVKNVGEKAKETVKGAWEATKDTTNKIKGGKGYGESKDY